MKNIKTSTFLSWLLLPFYLTTFDYYPKLLDKWEWKEAFNLSMDHLIEKKCPRVFITATKTAKGFYEKMGFTVTEPSNISIRGITLECYNMEKLI